MRSYRFVPVILLTSLIPSFSQNLVKGVVLNDASRQPIAYANIGILNTSIGTISNADGTFTLLVPENYQNEELHFSSLGFNKKNVPVSLLKKDQTVYLVERPQVLASVNVIGKKEQNKSFEFGNKEMKGGVYATDTVYAGSSKAILIRNELPSFYSNFAFPVFLKSARIKIFKNNWPSFKYRVRFYEVDSLHGGQPGNDLVNENIIVESTIRKGWLVIDLSNLKFSVSKPFFVAFEPILEDKDRLQIVQEFREFKEKNPKRVKIDTVLVDGKKKTRQIVKWADFPGTAVAISTTQFAREHFVCYSRRSSFDKWEHVRGILTCTVTLSNQVY